MVRETARSRNGSRRFWLGFGFGLIPIMLMLMFGFTSCPMLGMTDGYICHDPHQEIGSWLFISAVALYGAEALATPACLFIRPARLLALGMLGPLIIGPFAGILGFETVALARHPISLALSNGWLPW